MWTNYIKVAFRSLLKQRGYSVINILGLAVGMACCVLIMLWVSYELSYDRFHEHGGRIYRLANELTLGGNTRISASSSAPMVPAVMETFGEVESGVRWHEQRHIAVKYEDRRFFEERVVYTDPSLFNVFSLSMIQGRAATALEEPYSIVLTEEAAQKYFPEGNALGKLLMLNHSDGYRVTGIVESWPEHSHLQFDVLCSFSTLLQEDPVNWGRWGRFALHSYILLDEGSDAGELESKFPGMIETHMGALLKRAGGSVRLFLQPLTRIHLHSHLEAEVSENGSITMVIVFSSIAFVVLLIACINFVNLATARSASRAREVGIRKACGAAKRRLVGQFLSESLVYACVALAIAIVLVVLALPAFSAATGRGVTLSSIPWEWFLPLVIVLGLGVGLVSGTYPAFFLSSFDPAVVLKSGGQKGVSRYWFRRILVIFQFSVSIILLVAVLTVFSQLRFMKGTSLGFDEEHVVVLPGLDDIPDVSIQTLRNAMMVLPGVQSVTASDAVPGSGGRLTNFLPEGFPEDDNQFMREISTDERFLPAMGIAIAEGRNFTREFGTDIEEAALINRTAATQFGWSNPVGKTIRNRMRGDDGRPVWVSRTVVGVVEDFHLVSLHRKVEPLFIGFEHRPLSYLSIRLSPGNIQEGLARIQGVWNGIAPDSGFDYYFLDERFDEQYRAEERMNRIVSYFSILAVTIACLGLFGLAAYMAEKRTAEIGIRKVLGATNRGVVALLSREFLLLVIVSNVIAWPAAYFILRRWLENFAYRTQLHWSLFIVSGLATLFIALVSVSSQALRTASTNPVEALKYE